MSWPPTNAPLCADVSFGHDTITAAVARQLVGWGYQAIIGYVSPDPAKNATAQNIADWRSAGLLVGLVYEGTANWMQGGAAAGAVAGTLARVQARQVGYPDSCVLFAADDINSNTPTIDACYAAFAAAVGPHHGGRYGATAFLEEIADDAMRWQSNATSWSGNQIDPAASLLQYYNDPRAHGLPIDVNEIRHPLVSFMGATPPPEDDDMAKMIRDATPGSPGDMWVTDFNLGCSPVAIDGATEQVMAKCGLVIVDLTQDEIGIVRNQVSAQQNNLIHWIVAAIAALPPTAGGLTAAEITAAVAAGLASVTGTVTFTSPTGG